METVSNPKAINLLGLNQKDLEDFFVSIEEKPFRAVQVMKWMHQRGVSDFSKMTDLSNYIRVNNSDNFVYLNHNNVTGKWLLENTHTNKIYKYPM